MTMKRRVLPRGCGGLTVVELLLALALLSLVIALTTSLFVFGNQVFNKSRDVSQVQFDVRMAADLLTRELRNVTSISLSDNLLPPRSSANLVTLSDKYPLVRAVSFEIKQVGSRFLVVYDISGWQGSCANRENFYKLRSEVLLNNITSALYGSGETLFYRK